MRARTLIVMVMAALLVFSGNVLAERPPGVGGGGGGEGGGGGGNTTTDVFAEMVIIDRDVNGVPITILGLGPRDKWVQVPQPIMFGDKDDCPLTFADLDLVGTNSVYTVEGIEARYIPFVDGEIPEDYKLCMTEADLGRLSVVRSPDDVLDRALLEMVNTLAQVNEVYEEITLDAAGRLVVSYDDEYGIPVSKTIDAPAENLAAFQRILEQTELYHKDAVNGGVAIDLPVFPDHDDLALNLLDRTAPLLGAASDKFGHVGLDELIYVTQTLTLAGDMNADAKALFGQPWNGGYFNFSAFSYDRSVTYGGEVCYLKVTDVTEGDFLPIDMTGQIVKEPMMGLIFGGENYTGTNAYAYAQAVDDARAVIFWTHEHPVPVDLIDYCNLDNPPEPPAE